MKKTTKPKSQDRADRESYKKLGPLIRFAQSHPGTLARVNRRLSSLMGQPVHRQLTEAWLHPDEAKRVHPRHGIGILLRRIWEEISAEQERERVLRQARKETSYDEPNPTGCC